MGTRHTIMAILDGKTRLAQYGQWDGCPAGQGAQIINFLRTVDLETFKEKLRSTRQITEEELRALMLETGWEEVRLTNGKTTLSLPHKNCQKWDQDYPEYSRSTGARILGIIMKRPAGLRLELREDFPRNSLYCEWCYVIDLDNEMLEVYQGFNEEPLPKDQRFAHLEGMYGYEPVRLLTKIPFAELGDNTVQDLEELEPEQ